MTTTIAPRLAQALGSALADAFDDRPDLILLGEDVCAPYGGAFKVTREVSTRHPRRVRNTPLSEGGILGVANGLAVMGRHVVVEMMFGDFAALAFDQLLNMTAKSVSMYGQRHPMHVVVRCPVGARRGYGPTHSQSLQKHFIGIPNLVLHELSPFHDVGRQLEQLLADDRPAVLFEDKVLYTERAFPHEPADDDFTMERLGDWAHVRLRGEPAGERVALIVPGGVARRGMAAARTLRDRGVVVDLLVPGQLYPVEAEPLVRVLAGAAAVLVAEEGTAGGTWGAEVARVLHERAWTHLRAPVRTIASADATIPAAPHLERKVVLGEEDLVQALLDVQPPPDRTVPLVVPKLNNNDDHYLLMGWVVEDGAHVEADEPVLEVETSKAVQEILSPASGWLRSSAAAGSTCRPGEVVALVSCERWETVEPPAPAPRAQPSESLGGTALSRDQVAVAEVVSTSHREIPAAYALARVPAGPIHRAGLDVTAVTLRGIGRLLADHPLVFGRLAASGTSYVRAEAAHVAVTVDVGTGLTMPVLRDVGSRPVDDLLDELMDLRMKALRGRLSEDDLRGASIALSLAAPGIAFVQPIVPPGVAAIVSLAGDVEATDDPAAELSLGLAHDHRLVNGAEAMAFLTDLAALLRDPTGLADPA